MVVNSQNKYRYIQLTAKHLLLKSIRSQVIRYFRLLTYLGTKLAGRDLRNCTT
jgi:hypothetical protein